MTRFDNKYFKKFKFTPEQVIRNPKNTFKDLKIAKEKSARTSCGGGTEITAKECGEYLIFAERVLKRVKKNLEE